MRRRREQLGLAAVVLVGLLTYANSVPNDALWDGKIVLNESTAVRDPLDVRKILLSPYRITREEVEDDFEKNAPGAYRPLTVWSFAWTYRLNQALGMQGPQPMLHHLGNVLLFAALCGLLLLFLRKTLRAPLGGALAATLLFAVHPVHAEVVAGIVGRAEILAALFGLLLLMAHRAGVNPLLCGVLLLAALLSKESAAGFSAAAVAGDVLFGERGEWRKRAPHGCLYLLIGVLWWFGLRATAVGGADVTSDPYFGNNPLAQAETTTRVLTALRVQFDYLLLQVFPLELSIDYSYAEIRPIDTVLNLRVLTFLAVLATSLGLAWRWRRTHPRVTFAVLAYAMLFAPTSNLLLAIGSIMAERFLLSPSIFFCILVGEGYVALSRIGPRAHRAVRIGAVLVLVAFTVRTMQRNHVWHDLDAFVQARTEDAPNSALANLMAGATAWQRKRHEDALTHYRRSHELIPGAPPATGIGLSLEALGRDDEALSTYETVLVHFPDFIEARQRLVYLLIKKRRWSDASALIEWLEQSEPENVKLPELRALLANAVSETPSSRFRGLQVSDEIQLDRLLTSTDFQLFERQVADFYQHADRRSILFLTHMFLTIPWMPQLAPRSPYDYRMPKLRAWLMLEKKVANQSHLELTLRCLESANDPKGAAHQAACAALLDWTLAHLERLVPEKGPFGGTVFRFPSKDPAPSPSTTYRGLTQGEERVLKALLEAKGEGPFDARLGEVTEGRAPRSVLLLTHLLDELPWVNALAPRDEFDVRMKKLRVLRALGRLVEDTAHQQLCARYLEAAPKPGPATEAARSDLLDWSLKHLDQLVPAADAQGRRTFRLR